MKIVAISEYNWNINCPHCGELIDTQDADLAHGEIVKCMSCGKSSKIYVQKSIKDEVNINKDWGYL